MNHPVAVTLKTGPVRMLFLTVLPARTLAAFDGVRDQRFLFHLLDVLAIDQTLIPLKWCYLGSGPSSGKPCPDFSKFEHACLILKEF